LEALARRAAGETTTALGRSYNVIRKEDGTCRDFAEVCAIPALSAIVQRDASGTFVFLDAPDECRLSFVYRDDGARAVDYEAVHFYFDGAA
jgi:hypothetical protein